MEYYKCIGCELNVSVREDIREHLQRAHCYTATALCLFDSENYRLYQHDGVRYLT